MFRPLLSVAAAFALTLALAASLHAQNQTATLSPVVLDGNLPYTISLKVHDMGGAAIVPTLQSFAFGVYNNEWVLVAGRTNGLHNFTNDGFQNFPPAYQNTFIWVIDPATQETWSRALTDPTAGLTQAQIDELSATNTEFAQIGDRLYIAGGYVYDSTADNFTTYDTLTALDLASVVSWVKNGAPSLATHIRQTSNAALKVTGGELHIVNGRALLVFGQDFEGPYTPNSNGVYTKLVSAFDIVDDGSTLSIANLTQSTPQEYYRRRDLNVVPMMQSDGSGGFTQGLIALSGVFLPGSTGGAWTVPVEIDAAGTPSMADPNLPSTFKQGMNSYHSAVISLYSAQSDETHTISLGGISLEYYDAATQSIVEDDEIPFINGITSIVRTAAGAYTQYYLGEYPTIPNPSNGNAPFLFGATAAFITAPGIATYPNGMLQLDALTQPTVIGYVFGGIIAQQANFGASGASNFIFDVTYSPATAPTPTPTPTPAPPHVQVNGDSQRRTTKGAYVLKGSTNSDTPTIKWRLNGGKFHRESVAGNGTWAIHVRHLKSGKNAIRVLGISTTGQRSPNRKIVIVRR
jgi:hypothetical protein